MKQYCRYCSHCHYGDVAYCDVKQKTMSESSAKAMNNCKDFELNPIDVFMENEKGYRPREPKKTDCEGQISLFGKE